MRVRYITKHSYWDVDTDAHIVSRIPHEESPDGLNHPVLEYTEIGTPQEYTEMQLKEDGRGCWYWFEMADGQKVNTGYVLRSQLLSPA